MSSKTITLHRAKPADAIKIMKFFHKAHANNLSDLPKIVDRFALPWITDVLCYGVGISASLNGRLIGTIGLSKTHYPWNHYQQFFATQWLNVLDDYKDSDVCDELVRRAREVADEQGLPLQIDIPHYLYKESDESGRTVNRSYFFKRGSLV